MVFDYPLNKTRKQALVRRANKLLSWLERDEYAKYVDENSTVHLKKLIGRIIWALEQSLNAEDWREFLLMFQDARKMLPAEDSDEPELAYNDSVASLIATLERYRGHVEDWPE